MKLLHALVKIMKKDKRVLLVVGIFILHMFLRVYNLEEINPFGWDQVDNAWAARNIIDDGQFPLVGMQAKNNSGLYIGPLYYYFVAAIYFLTNLDPIASPIIAFVTSVLTCVTLFWVTKKLFSMNIALIATFIYTVSYYAITFDRIQWPVNFIMLLSLLIFYYLFKVLEGKEKYILFLAIAIGFSFHIHFTSIFYPIIVMLSLPFFPRTKKTLLFTGIGIIVFLLFLSPIIASIIINASNAQNLSSYSSSYNHGFHLRRFLQLTHDAVIKYESIIRWESIKFAKFIILPTLLLTYAWQNRDRKGFLFCYLIVLWFLIPWIIFSMYSGEISDYYFTSTLPFVFISLAYLTMQLFQRKHVALKIGIVLFWLYFAIVNIAEFLPLVDGGSLAQRRRNVQEAITSGTKYTYTWGVPEPFFYYLHIRKSGNEDDMKRFFNKL